MNAKEYQELARRTECDMVSALNRVRDFSNRTIRTRTNSYNYSPPNQAIRLIHAQMGLSGEVGEFAGAIERWLYYGQPLDEENVIEELGDKLWYIDEACSALGITIEDLMRLNIAKLRQRFPDKYDGELVKEENRDRAAERKVIEDGYAKTAKAHMERNGKQDVFEQTGAGWAEPIGDDDL